MAIKIDSFYCDNCGGGLFYVLVIENKNILLLCKNCALISEINEKQGAEINE